MYDKKKYNKNGKRCTLKMYDKKCMVKECMKKKMYAKGFIEKMY